MEFHWVYLSYSSDVNRFVMSFGASLALPRGGIVSMQRCEPLIHNFWMLLHIFTTRMTAPLYACVACIYKLSYLRVCQPRRPCI